MSKIEQNSVIQGDCLEVMKDIPDNSIDLILTDPPYLYLKHKLDRPFDEKVFFDQAKQAILQKLQEEYKRGYNDAKAGYGTLEEYGTLGEFKLVDPREFTKQEEQ